MRYFAILALIALFATPHISQTPEELHASARSAAEERRYADALSSLRVIEQKFPQIFAANNYDYLAARLSERAGDTASASAYYLSAVKRGSVLKPYALYHLSAGARGSGNLVLERTYLDEIAAFYPGSLLADAARNRRARSWFDSGNYEQAVKAFESLASGAAKPAAEKGEDLITRENRLLLARSLLLSGDTAGARDIFTSLIGSLANPAQPDDIALAAVKVLDKLGLDPALNEQKVPKLSDYEHLRRASIYQFNRDFPDARLHYAAIIADHPSSGIVPDAIFQTGRGFVQEGNFPDAVQWFERAVEQFPEHPISKDALMQAGSAYARMGKYREGIKRYQDYIAKYPNDERLDRAYLNIIDIFRDEGEETEAKRWAAKTQEVFRGKQAETQALFAAARIDIARDDWTSALAKLEKLLTMPDLGGIAVPGGTNKAEVTFLQGYVLEQLRDFPAAIEAYLSIADGRGEYYGWRATERLQAMARSPEAKPAIENKLNSLAAAETKDLDVSRKNLQAAIRLTSDAGQKARLLESLQKIYSAIPAYKKIPAFKLANTGRTDVRKAPQTGSTQDVHRTLADDLAFLGLFDEAAPEMEAASKIKGPLEGDQAFTLAVVQNRGDRAYRAIVFAEPQWRSVPADYQVELIPRQSIELLYPTPHADAFLKYAPPQSVDPRFLLSIVRQESRYRPDIKSYAAARGMMQFISTTSNKIAAELGRTGFDQDELYDPATAILFGSRYVSNLFKLFPDQPDAVAASYNGGEDNMRRWMKRSKSTLAGLYVPEIAFSQSKDYVYKVMSNYRMYRLFYEENLGAKQHINE